ncbi:MAG TPA: sigma-70 family RNA polymerase sigma factor [Polyangiaceae bacterium]|nr:sigma-70 family RNA polymerase sigma factor [Polyangiaceae bacterium]
MVRPGVEGPGVPSELPARLELERIYDEYFDFVWRSLQRLGVGPSLLDDALQDVFVVVHRRLSDFEGRSTLKTWLFGICMRVASDYARRHKQQAGSVEPSDVVDLGARDPLEQAARTEAVAFLYAQLAELDDDKRAVFILAELEDMSCAEIAVAVGANVNTVTSRLKAARLAFEAGVRRYQARDRRKLGGSR